jgi:uncharacterized protein with PQ loop repeat
MPDQIKANHRRKSTDSLSNWFLMSTFVSYVMWVVHGLIVHDMSLVLGQGQGVLVTGVIVAQMVMYRTHTDAGKKPTIPLWDLAHSMQKISNRAKALTSHVSESRNITE